jgi:hypothetical protein
LAARAALQLLLVVPSPLLAEHLALPVLPEQSPSLADLPLVRILMVVPPPSILALETVLVLAVQ